MKLNTLAPAPGSKSSRKRVGRGTASGVGKTCGRGHKGQKSRSGGFHKVGFEGGQMPIQRRLPKRGFYSRKSMHSVEVRLHEIDGLDVEAIDLSVLVEQGVVPAWTKRAKVISSGSISRKVSLQGLAVTAGAKAAIESAGGQVEVLGI